MGKRGPSSGFLLAVTILTALACTLPGASGVPTAEPASPGTEAQAAPTDTLSPDEAADVVFYNGTILTMQPGVITTAIAIKGDRILTLGNDDRMLQLAGPETAVVDLQGRTLMPGFVDSHNHAFDQSGGDYRGAMEYVLSNGITTMADLFVTEDLLLALSTMNAAGELQLRVSLYPVHIDNCGTVLGGWYPDAFPVSREPGAMLQIPGVKMFNDGGSCNAPAVSYEYPGGVGNGDLYFSAEELAGHISEVQANGYQVAIHSIGDRAIAATQDAIALALGGGPNDYRHRIEHNTVLPPELMPRYGEIGIVGTLLGAFPTCIWQGDVSGFKYITPEEFRDLEWPWRSLIDANPETHFAWHSDYPIFTIDPFDNLYSFVTRKQVAGDGSICEPHDWAADDKLSVDEALRLMTIEAAYAILRDDELGSLAIGKLADLIVISANPLAVDPDELPGIEVLMTMVGGRTVYCSEGAGSYCP